MRNAIEQTKQGRELLNEKNRTEVCNDLFAFLNFHANNNIYQFVFISSIL